MTYAWIITKDCSPDPRFPEGTNMNAKGIMGPGNASHADLSMLKRGHGHPFRMLDGDGEVMYEGRYAGDPNAEEAFGPLDDFGTPNAGATSIEYLRNGKWEEL